MSKQLQAWADDVRRSLNALLDEVDAIVEAANNEPEAEVGIQSNEYAEPQLGDIVRLMSVMPGSKWNGFQGRLVGLKEHPHGLVKIKPLGPRPDGRDMDEFYWESHNVVKVESQPTFLELLEQTKREYKTNRTTPDAAVW